MGRMAVVWNGAFCNLRAGVCRVSSFDLKAGRAEEVFMKARCCKACRRRVGRIAEAIVRLCSD